MTFFEIVNEIFKAHREGNVVRKYILMDMLDEVEPTYSDTLDAIGYQCQANVMRIDKLVSGTVAKLKFHGSRGNQGYIEEFYFLGIDGKGDDRTAEFQYIEGEMTWKAYRYNGRWAYGTSADRLSLVE